MALTLVRAGPNLVAFLFNSYYVQAGERHWRAQRGLVTRPTVEEGERLAALAAAVGFRIVRTFTDGASRFWVVYLAPRRRSRERG